MTSKPHKADASPAVLTRAQINSVSFDPLSYLSAQIMSIPIDHILEPEKKLNLLLEGLLGHLTGLSLEVEDEVQALQREALQMEARLLADLDSQSLQLNEVDLALDQVKQTFVAASEGAVRVGVRLGTAEKERKSIVEAVDLLTIISELESLPEDVFENVHTMDSHKLRESLPTQMRALEWSDLSIVLYDLRTILSDISSEEVHRAQKSVLGITEGVERELLGQFDNILDELMEEADNKELIVKAKALAECLHLFNNGQALQRRYIFSVVQKRMPGDDFFRLQEDNGFNPWDKVKKVLKLKKLGDDDTSSAGASDNEEEARAAVNAAKEMAMHVINHESRSLELIDHLSGLFAMINSVCLEQFSLIRQIFPLHTVARVTRVLVQRIFNDPAFGIQARVDAVLSPAPPAPTLPLSEYLDALLTVREKLNALYLLLLDCSSDPAMRGMGSESVSLRKARREMEQEKIPPGGEANGEEKKANHGIEDEDEDIEERVRSDAEIRDFLDDQVSNVLTAYVGGYFEKEILHVRSQYVICLRRAVEDTTSLTKVSAGTLLQLPRLRAEKLKSIPIIVKSVANKPFLNAVFAVTTDAVLRMESIGRDDRKLLDSTTELFMLQLQFLVEGVLVPWTRASTNILLKMSAMKAPASSLPPAEVLLAISALLYGKSRVKGHFDEVFMRPLAASPNHVLICKESRRKQFKTITNVATECMFAYSIAIIQHFDKLLGSLQSKYDYQPKFDALTNLTAFTGGSSTSRVYIDPSTACDAVCKAFIQVTNSFRAQEASLKGLDVNSLFWKPLGQQFMGILISHIRRQKVSTEGAKLLARDLEEYRHVTAMTDSPEIIDMMVCLEEVCKVYFVDAEEVARMVVEEFRHLDISIVLALTKARADFSTRTNDHWSKVLSAKFMNYKWEGSLPWESKKAFTVLSFAEVINGSRSLGPLTLRRASAPITSRYVSESLRNNHFPTNGSKGVDRVAVDGNNSRASEGVISLDLSLLEQDEDNLHKRLQALENQHTIKIKTAQIYQQQERLISSRFFAYRPDDHDQHVTAATSTASPPSTKAHSSPSKHGNRLLSAASRVADTRGAGSRSGGYSISSSNNNSNSSSSNQNNYSYNQNSNSGSRSSNRQSTSQPSPIFSLDETYQSLLEDGVSPRGQNPMTTGRRSFASSPSPLVSPANGTNTMPFAMEPLPMRLHQKTNNPLRSKSAKAERKVSIVVDEDYHRERDGRSNGKYSNDSGWNGGGDYQVRSENPPDDAGAHTVGQNGSGRKVFQHMSSFFTKK